MIPHRLSGMAVHRHPPESLTWVALGKGVSSTSLAVVLSMYILCRFFLPGVKRPILPRSSSIAQPRDFFLPKRVHDGFGVSLPEVLGASPRDLGCLLWRSLDASR